MVMFKSPMEASIPEALERVRTGAAPVLRSVMRVGDVEVINPSTVHRGSPNRTHQPRCVLSFTFQPAAHEALGSPAARAEIEAGLLRPGTFVYYDDYTLEHWLIPNRTHAYKEERLAHEEVTREYGLEWLPLFRYGAYPGPLNVSRVKEFPAEHKGRPIRNSELSPVLPLGPRRSRGCPS